MTSFQTFFRAVVMLATLGIVAKAWHLYGPSVDELGTIAQRAVQVADDLWAEYEQRGTAATSDVHDPRLGAPGIASAPRPPAAVPQQPVLIAAAETRGPDFAQQAVAVSPIAPSSTPAALSSPPSSISPPQAIVEPAPVGPVPRQDDRLQAAAARLAQLGARDQELQPWGNDGRWYRFSCSATWVDAPNYSRHFEAVSADPAQAVEQVEAEIEAWRRTQLPATSLSSQQPPVQQPASGY